MRAAAGRPAATQRVSCARGCAARKPGEKKAQRRSAPALALTAPSEPSQSWKSTAVPSAAEDALRCQRDARALACAQKRSALTGPLPLHSRAGVGEADDAVAVVGVDSGRGRGAANNRRSSAVSNSRRAVDGSFLVVFVAEEATAGGKKRGQGKADRANRGTAEGWDRGAHAWSSENLPGEGPLAVSDVLFGHFKRAIWLDHRQVCPARGSTRGPARVKRPAPGARGRVGDCLRW